MRKLRSLPTAIALAVIATAGIAAPTHATFPGQNGPIAFRADTGSGYQIYTVNPNGHDLAQLTHVIGDTNYPDWSPDGRRLAFEFDAADGSGCSVELMNPDGSNVVDLTTDTNVCEAAPSFTPDGSRLVFERYDPATNIDAIWSMNLTGGDRHLITVGTGLGVTNPEVSPDGTMLSFVDFNGTDTGSALYVCRMDGSGLLGLTPFSADVAVKQEWAPDGRRLVFSYDADVPLPGLSANVATIRPDGTDLRSLTHYTGGLVNAFVGSYSPDGQWIVFRLEDHGQFALYRMNPDGGALHAILPLSSFRPRGIDWGPAQSKG